MDYSKEHPRKQIIIKIVQALRKNKVLSINELAAELKSNWSTININLGLLKEIGIVKEENKKTGRFFSLTKTEYNTDTLFGLPLSKRGEQYSKFLFYHIKRIWFEQTKKRLERTRAHKLAVKIANDFNLPVPRGWYMYGELLVLQYNDDVDYVTSFKPAENKELLKRIAEVVIKSKNKTISDLKDEQYIHNPLYLNANELHDALTSATFDKEDCLKIKEKLYSVLFKLKVGTEYRAVTEVVDGFSSVLIQLLKLRKNQLQKLKSKIVSAFNEVWHLIALMNFYNSLRENKFEIYHDQLLSKYLSSAFEICKNNAEEQLLDLSEYNPLIKVKDNKIKKYKGIAKSQNQSA